MLAIDDVALDELESSPYDTTDDAARRREARPRCLQVGGA
jgi:hypothetical protein